MRDRVVSYVFRGNFSNLGAGLAVQGKNVKEFGNKLTALDKQGRQMRSGLATVGDGAGKVGLAAAAGFTIAVAKAAKFDQAMSHVEAATHETAGNMQLLRKAAMDAGQATQYSATEAAGAIEQLAKAGVSTTAILDGGLDGALNLAAAGSMEVADAAEIAATAMTQFKLSGDQIPHVADLLAAGAGKAQGEVSDMGMALQQAGLVASQTGLSIEETTGALAQFAANGLLGSDAGTSFKTMLQALTPNSEKAAALMAELGINAYDAQGNFVGMSNFAGQLQESLGELSVEQQNAALKTIFGSDAVRAAAIIFKDGAAGVEQWQNNVNDAGYAAETAAAKTDNLLGDLERLGGALETAFIGAGSGSQGGLRSLVQNAESAVGVFNKMPASVQSSTTALLGLTAVTGGALWFGSKVVNGIADTRQALADLGWTAGSTNGKLKGIAAASGGLALMTGALIGAAEAVDRLNGSFESSTLDRDFEALAGGDTTANMESLVDSLETLTKAGSAPALADLSGELVTLFGALGNTDVDQAAADIKALDEYLAGLVESGNAELAATQFDALVEGLAAAEHTKPERVLDDVTDRLKQYSTAVKNAADEGGPFAGVMEEVSTATEDFGTAARAAAVDSEKLAAATEKSRDAARTTAKSFVGLGDSLNDSKVSLGDWIADMRAQANALRDFRVNAETAGRKGLREGLIKELQAAGPEGAMRMKQLAGATKQQIAEINAAWSSGKREVNRFTDALGGVESPPPIDVVVNTGSAMSKLQSLRDAIGSIPSIPASIAAPKPRKKAAGGFIVGPGSGTSDEIPALLSNGEYVVKASAVQRYGVAMFDGYNAERFATGGLAGGKRPAPKSLTVSGTTPDGIYQVEVGKSVSSAASALTFMQTIVKGLNGDLKTMGQEIREAKKAIKRETDARDAIATKVADQQGVVDRLTGLYDGLSSTIQSGLAANQFADVEVKDPWASSVAGGLPSFEEVLRRLDESTENAKDFSTATGTLTANGLTGSALESVLAQGLPAASMFAKLTPEQLAQYQASFDTNALEVGKAGAGGGDAVYGQELGRQNELLAAQQAELARSNQALDEANRAANRAEKARDRAEKQRDQAIENQRSIRDELGEIRSEIKKARGDVESAARGKR